MIPKQRLRRVATGIARRGRPRTGRRRHGHCLQRASNEWAVAVFKHARAAGLQTGFVSNGNGTPQVLEYIHPHIDFYKVDLKSFNDRRYHELGGRLQPILETIRALYRMGVWLEIVTLLIPGFNDSDQELQKLAELRRFRRRSHGT